MPVATYLVWIFTDPQAELLRLVTIAFVSKTREVAKFVFQLMSLGHLLGYVVRRLVIINNQVLKRIKIAVESDVKNWAYISRR